MQNKQSNFTHKSLLPNEEQLNGLWNNFVSVNNIGDISKDSKIKILNILAINSTRHTANWSDADVQLLNYLELEAITYANRDLLNKIRAIVIETDFIRIAGFELSRFDMNNDFESSIGVFTSELSKSQYFTYNAAIRALENSGLNLITKEQLQLIINAIPCEDEELLPQYLIILLNLSVSGFRSKASGNIIDTKTGNYWLLNNDPELGHSPSFSINNNTFYTDGIHSSQNALLIRTIKQKSYLN